MPLSHCGGMHGQQLLSSPRCRRTGRRPLSRPLLLFGGGVSKVFVCGLVVGVSGVSSWSSVRELRFLRRSRLVIARRRLVWLEEVGVVAYWLVFC